MRVIILRGLFRSKCKLGEASLSCNTDGTNFITLGCDPYSFEWDLLVGTPAHFVNVLIWLLF